MITRSRTILCAAIAFGTWIARETSAPPQNIEVTVTEGTAMAAAALPDRRWIGLDRLRSRVYRDVIDVVAKSGMTLTPTLSAHGGFEASVERDRSIMRDARVSLFPGPLAEHFRSLAPEPRMTTRVREDQKKATEAAMKPFRDSVKAIVVAGGRIIAGSDAHGHARLPYGLSLHTELEQFVDAGMTPFQALQTATAAAAAALGVESELGTIETGKLADLVFLGGDPLQNIRNTRDVRRVMRGGRVYDQRALGVPSTLGTLGVPQQPPR